MGGPGGRGGAGGGCGGGWRKVVLARARAAAGSRTAAAPRRGQARPPDLQPGRPTRSRGSPRGMGQPAGIAGRRCAPGGRRAA